MLRTILFMLGVLSCSLVFANNPKSIVTYKSSNDSFIVTAPDDLVLDKTIGVKGKPAFAIYTSKKSQYFHFTIVSKTNYQAYGNAYRNIENIYRDLYSNSPYELTKKFVLESVEPRAGMRYLLKYTKSSPQHFMHIVILEGSDDYYLIQLRDTRETLPKWFYLSNCKANVCEKVNNQQILTVPSGF